MDLPFSLGVVIPCHKPYIPYLKKCLDSIEAQTVKPSSVLVVCSSSTDRDIPNEYRTKYSFPLLIVTREGAFNAAENRNYGSNLLQTDVVSFFDADDVMHPQRIEILFKAMKDADIALHSFIMLDERFEPSIQSPKLHKNMLKREHTGCVIFIPDYTKRIHHGHVTLRKTVLDFVRFPENWSLYTRKEDSLFCGTVVSMVHLRTVYIEEELSWYRINH